MYGDGSGLDFSDDEIEKGIRGEGEGEGAGEGEGEGPYMIQTPTSIPTPDSMA